MTVAEEIAAFANERESRRSLMKSAAAGNVLAQVMIEAIYDAWIYSPIERMRFALSRAAATEVILPPQESRDALNDGDLL